MLPSTLMRIRVLCAPLIWLLAVAAPAYPWGAEGHTLIMRIAGAAHAGGARAGAEILGPGKTLESVASWADEVPPHAPQTGPWHYIDIPIDQPHMVLARDCPKSDCVVAKIEDFRKALNAPATSPDERREAPHVPDPLHRGPPHAAAFVGP